MAKRTTGTAGGTDSKPRSKTSADRSTWRPRDPEGRRALIISTASDLIAEVGVRQLTHRLVADRADIPVGSTTYYFASLEDLLAAAMEYQDQQQANNLQYWDDRLLASNDLAVDMAELVVAYLEADGLAMGDYELYVTAFRSPRIRQIAQDALNRITAALTPCVGASIATELAAFSEGIILRSLIMEKVPERADLTRTFRKLLGEHGG